MIALTVNGDTFDLGREQSGHHGMRSPEMTSTETAVETRTIVYETRAAECSCD